MTLGHAIILGLVQGFGELLPISSSAHLALAPYFLEFPDQGLAFDVALHFGTLMALVWYFRREWIEMLRSVVQIVRTRSITTVHERRALYLVVATILGVFFSVLLGCGLFALSFFSDKSGHDQSVRDATSRDGDRTVE